HPWLCAAPMAPCSTHGSKQHARLHTAPMALCSIYGSMHYLGSRQHYSRFQAVRMTPCSTHASVQQIYLHAALRILGSMRESQIYLHAAPRILGSMRESVQHPWLCATNIPTCSTQDSRQHARIRAAPRALYSTCFFDLDVCCSLLPTSRSSRDTFFSTR
ncbi:hypothetical protein J6590_088891, partial [Homalodisca vitripennis]